MKRTHIIIISVILLTLVTSVGLYTYHRLQSDGLPKNVRTQISNYTPYYPPKKSLPAGYYVDDTTFSIEQSTLVFTIKSTDDASLLVSQQKTPDNFDFNFFEKNLKNTRNSQTKEGTIVAGEIEGRHIASMRYGDTWIMISAPSTVSLSELETVARSFRR